MYPLSSVLVLDLSRVLAGPYCTMLLADLGADVVKIERPGEGDETRQWGPPSAGGESAYFLSVNRSKRSCAVDLARPEGREIVRRLAARADVVIENFRPGAAERLGLGYGDLQAVNPRLVYCSITGFGSRRDPPDRPGYDFVAQAESGLMAVTGPVDGEPSKVGVAVVDVLAGTHAAVAVLAALHAQRGARIEVPLLDTALAALVNVAENALLTGDEPGRFGNAHASIVPYETFRASDGWIAVAAANDGLFVRLCDALGAPDLATDKRFATNPERVRNRRELIPLLSARFAEHPMDEWLGALDAAGVPAGKVRGVLDALHAAERAGDVATARVEHPTAGPLDLVRSPLHFASGIRAPEPPPLLGQHTAEVLHECGCADEEVSALARAGVIAVS